MLIVSNKAATNTVNRNLLMEENIDRFEGLLAIRQKFPRQNFLTTLRKLNWVLYTR